MKFIATILTVKYAFLGYIWLGAYNLLFNCCPESISLFIFSKIVFMRILNTDYDSVRELSAADSYSLEIDYRYSNKWLAPEWH